MNETTGAFVFDEIENGLKAKCGKYWYLLNPENATIYFKTKSDFEILNTEYLKFDLGKNIIITDYNGKIKTTTSEKDLIADLLKLGIEYSAKKEFKNNKKPDKRKIYGIPEEYYAIKRDDKWGVIDNNSNIIIDFKYYDLFDFFFYKSKKLYFSAKDPKTNFYGIIDINENVIIPFMYDEIYVWNIDDYADETLMVEKDNKCAVIDINNNILLDFKYKYIYGFCCCNYSLAQSTDNKWGFINKKGEPIKLKLSGVKEFKPQKQYCLKEIKDKFVKFDALESFHDDLSICIVNLKRGNYWYGIEKSTGKSVYKVNTGKNGHVSWNFGNLFTSDDGYYQRAGKKDGVYHYINKYGEYLFSARYQHVMLIVNDLFAYMTEDFKFGLMDNKGNKLTEPIYDNAPQWIEYKDYITVEQNGKHGILDCNFNTIIPIEYDCSFACNLFLGENKELLTACKNGKYGVINFKNEVVIPFMYDYISSVNNHTLYKGTYENKIVVEKNGKEGMINDKNEVLLPFEYDDIGFLSDETLIIRDRKKEIEYIADYSGKRICNTDFHRINVQIDSNNKYFVANLKEQGKGAVIDKYGNIVFDFKYQNINIFYNCDSDKFYFIVTYENNLKNILDESGKKLLPCDYERITIIDNNTILAKRKGKYGLIDFDNNVIFDFLLDNLQTVKEEFNLACIGNKYALMNNKGEIIKIDITTAKEIILPNIC